MPMSTMESSAKTGADRPRARQADVRMVRIMHRTWQFPAEMPSHVDETGLCAGSWAKGLRQRGMMGMFDVSKRLRLLWKQLEAQWT
jgi:hypothetical protein